MCTHSQTAAVNLCEFDSESQQQSRHGLNFLFYYFYGKKVEAPVHPAVRSSLADV